MDINILSYNKLTKHLLRCTRSSFWVATYRKVMFKLTSSALQFYLNLESICDTKVWKVHQSFQKMCSSTKILISSIRTSDNLRSSNGGLLNKLWFKTRYPKIYLLQLNTTYIDILKFCCTINHMFLWNLLNNQLNNQKPKYEKWILLKKFCVINIG